MRECDYHVRPSRAKQEGDGEALRSRLLVERARTLIPAVCRPCDVQFPTSDLGDAEHVDRWWIDSVRKKKPPWWEKETLPVHAGERPAQLVCAEGECRLVRESKRSRTPPPPPPRCPMHPGHSTPAQAGRQAGGRARSGRTEACRKHSHWKHTSKRRPRARLFRGRLALGV